jgi:ubiquinone/menaquinone biosynthesis C-methylase UbiE
MNLEEQRAAEQARYEHIYSGKDKRFVRYGTSNHGKNAIPQMRQLGLLQDRLADIGGGRGQFAQQALASGVKEAWSIDFASSVDKHEGGFHSVKAPAHDLPLQDGQVSVVTSFDMMEHLIPEEVPAVLREMRRVATTAAVFSISYSRSSHTLHDRGLHLTIRPERWWVQQIEKYMDPVEKVFVSGGYIFAIFSSVSRLNDENFAGKDVIVVGNGRARRPWHPKEVVLRFNLFQPGPCTFCWCAGVAHVVRSNAGRDIYIAEDPRPKSIKLRQHYREALAEAAKVARSVTLVPSFFASSLQKQLGSFPSSGLQALHYLMENEAASISICGFDLLYSPSVEVCKAHNPAKEHYLLNTWVQEKRIQAL